MQEDVLEVVCDRPEEAMGEIEQAARGEGSGPVRQGPARGGRRRRSRGGSEIRRRLAERGFAVRQIEKITPSLEDVFVSLIEARDRAEQPQEEVQR